MRRAEAEMVAAPGGGGGGGDGVRHVDRDLVGTSDWVQVMGYGLWVIGYGLNGCRIQGIGERLKVTGYRLQVIGYRLSKQITGDVFHDIKYIYVIYIGLKLQVHMPGYG